MKIISVIILLFVMLSMGCGSSRFTIEQLPDGTIKKEVRYTAIGTRKFSGVEIDINKGKVKLGSSEGKAGDMITLFKNLSEIMGKMAVIP